MSFGHGIRTTNTERETVIIKACSLEGHTKLALPSLYCHCWWLLTLIPHYGQNCTSPQKTSLPMTCSELEGVFFTPVKETIHPPPCLIASMSLQLFYQMENQDSKISNNTLHQRDPQKSKECVFLGWTEDKRESSVFWKSL